MAGEDEETTWLRRENESNLGNYLQMQIQEKERLRQEEENRRKQQEIEDEWRIKRDIELEE